MTEFTPIASLAGGIMIGLSAVLFMWGNGRIAGISGLVSRLLPPYEDNAFLVRAAFVLGLILAPAVTGLANPLLLEQAVSENIGLMAFAGGLVGFGAVLSRGCTSGHGVCGLSRLSIRSIVATCVFMAAAVVTVFVVRHVVGA